VFGLPQRCEQRSRLPQQIQAGALNRVLRVVKRDPFFLFGEPRIIHLLLGSAAFAELCKQQRNLIARVIQIQARHFLRRVRFL